MHDHLLYSDKPHNLFCVDTGIKIMYLENLVHNDKLAGAERVVNKLMVLCRSFPGFLQAHAVHILLLQF